MNTFTMLCVVEAIRSIVFANKAILDPCGLKLIKTISINDDWKLLESYKKSLEGSIERQRRRSKYDAASIGGVMFANRQDKSFALIVNPEVGIIFEMVTKDDGKTWQAVDRIDQPQLGLDEEEIQKWNTRVEFTRQFLDWPQTKRKPVLKPGRDYGWGWGVYSKEWEEHFTAL